MTSTKIYLQNFTYNSKLATYSLRPKSQFTGIQTYNYQLILHQVAHTNLQVPDPETFSPQTKFASTGGSAEFLGMKSKVTRGSLITY